MKRSEIIHNAVDQSVSHSDEPILIWEGGVGEIKQAQLLPGNVTVLRRRVRTAACMQRPLYRQQYFNTLNFPSGFFFLNDRAATEHQSDDACETSGHLPTL